MIMCFAVNEGWAVGGLRRRWVGVLAALALTAWAPPGAAQDAETPGEAPGIVAVDPEAAERALERTLTAEGALLLPAGRFEIEPSVQYLRRETDSFLIEPGDFGEVDVERDETTLGLDIRLGLPFDTQFEIGVPFEFVNSERTAVTAFEGRRTSSNSGSGIGDIDIGLAATVLREEGFRPDVIARVTWDTATGEETDGDLLLGESFNELRGSVTLLKRQDPLAFVGSAFYETVFEDDGVDPGDSFGFGLQAVLAASPETSLSLGFQQSFGQDAEVDGRTIDNSGATQGILTLGASSILAQGLLLNFTLGVGLSDDAPDYFIRLSLPFRPAATLF